MSAKKGTKRKEPEPDSPKKSKKKQTKDLEAKDFKTYKVGSKSSDDESEEKPQARDKKIFKFPTLPHSGYKLAKTKDTWCYKITMDESKPITLVAFSEDGIGVGMKSSKTYLRFDDLKDGSEVHEYLENVDKWTKKVANITRKQLQELWGLTSEEFSALTVVLQDGDEAWVASSYNEDPDKPRDTCFWPHNQYTRILDFKASTGKEKKATSGLAGKIDRSANSTWVCNIALKSCSVTLNREAGLITYKPWPSLTSLMWIDEGQDTAVDLEKKEERKKKKEEAVVKPMVEAAKKFLSKNKKDKGKKKKQSSDDESDSSKPVNTTIVLNGEERNVAFIPE